MNFIMKMQDLLDKTKSFNFVALLFLRIFLAPIMIIAGYGKLTSIENTAYYFGEYLGMPAPELMAVDVYHDRGGRYRTLAKRLACITRVYVDRALGMAYRPDRRRQRTKGQG
jgi:hypothetical protein